MHIKNFTNNTHNLVLENINFSLFLYFHLKVQPTCVHSFLSIYEFLKFFNNTQLFCQIFVTSVSILGFVFVWVKFLKILREEWKIDICFSKAKT